MPVLWPGAVTLTSDATSVAGVATTAIAAMGTGTAALSSKKLNLQSYLVRHLYKQDSS